MRGRQQCGEFPYNRIKYNPLNRFGKNYFILHLLCTHFRKISSEFYTVALQLFAAPVAFSPLLLVCGLRDLHTASAFLGFFAGEIVCIFASVVSFKFVLSLVSVYDDGEALIFIRKNSETRVPLDKITAVSERNFPLPPTVTVKFALLYGIEDTYSFLPAEDQENITRDLLARVAQAKANNQILIGESDA